MSTNLIFKVSNFDFSRHKDELNNAKELNGHLQSKLNEREKQVFS